MVDASGPQYTPWQLRTITGNYNCFPNCVIFSLHVCKIELAVTCSPLQFATALTFAADVIILFIPPPLVVLLAVIVYCCSVFFVVLLAVNDNASRYVQIANKDMYNIIISHTFFSFFWGF